MADDPCTTPVTPSDSYAELGLLLAERDREERILARAPRPGAPEGEDAIDEQILAGLVSP